MLTNPVLISVVVMLLLSLLKLNVIFSLIAAALVGGLISGINILETMKIFIGGMGGGAEVALSYLLLGVFAIAIGRTGVVDILAKKIDEIIKDKKKMLVLSIALIASFSQNLVPVHIAFIPILIPPLIGVMNKLKLDRRAVACGLTFGLKAPYMAVPAGFGLIFQGLIARSMVENGMMAEQSTVWKVMIIPVLGMIVGLFIAIFFSYRKSREYEDVLIVENEGVKDRITKEHLGAIAGIIVAFVLQLIFESLPISALAGLATMLLLRTFKISDVDGIVDGGIGLMGFIAFVMLIAAGYADVIRATGGVNELVEGSVAIIGGSKVIAAFTMLLVGLVITLGIGSSFSTIPVIATIFVPLCIELGFSIPATICILGTSGALGDAGSPASDSTLGPSAGLNVDGQHDHIWDTVVPTFLHFNIPLLIMGTIGALIL